MTSRRGVSLMEVLVSIGVVAIGLMGVATLIPLAFHQTETGARNERKVSLSKRAFREVHVLGVANPQRWANPTAWYLNGTVDVSNAQFHSPGIRSAFCIDPRWVAHNAFVPNSNVTKNANAVANHFTLPAMPSNVLTAEIEKLWRGDYSELMGVGRGPALMPRVTLRPAANVEYMMTLAHADEIFIAQDDLEFELPKEKILPPIQTALGGASGPLKRYAQGGFSWFATLVPEGGVSDIYKLSIVVCQQRNLAAAETVVPVRVSGDPNIFRGYAALATNSNFGDMRGVGFAGGDIVVDISGVGELQIKPGEYVMLSRHVLANTNPDGTPIFAQRFQWYRVVAIENELPRSAFLTLHGADWDFKPIVGNNPNNDIRRQVTYLTYTPGVTSVFEKTVRLEQSSLWTN